MPGDDLYWTPIESDESYQEKDPYIDPWDLENYAYIRNHLDYTELCSNPSAPSGSSGEFVESQSHSFQYVPAVDRPGPSYLPSVRLGKPGFDLISEHENYAAIDEIGIYNRRTRSEMYVPVSRRKIMDEYDSEPEEVSPYAEGIVPGKAVFGIYDEKGVFRKVSLPIPNAKTSSRDRRLSFSYGDRDKKYDLSALDDTATDQEDSIMTTIETAPGINRSSTKPENFGFSKHGHLKIDYSYSWNNLNRYIKYN